MITGGGGFIGKHLVKRLLKQNVRLWIVDINEKIHSEPIFNSKKIKIINSDLKNARICNEMIKKIKPDIVYHLASNIDRNLKLSNYKILLFDNYIPTLNLFASLIKYSSVQRVVFLGTCEEYGDKKIPFREDMCPDPVTPYSLYKTFSIYLALMLYKYENFPVVILRPPIVYGPGQNPSMFVPALMVDSILKRQFLMTKGEQIRDFLYIDDLIEALILAGHKAKINGKIINIGTSLNVKIRDVVQIIVKLNNNENYCKIGALPYRESEIMYYVPNVEKAQKLLNWKSKTSLTDGLRKTFNWYKRNISVYI